MPPDCRSGYLVIFPSRHDPGRFNGYNLSQTIQSDTPMSEVKVTYIHQNSKSRMATQADSVRS